MEISIFCDESCYLEHDDSDVMVLGAVSCELDSVPEISRQIRAIKRKHGLKPPGPASRGFELKWTKVSPAKLAFYEELMRFFLDEPRLAFRGVIVPEKEALDHDAYRETHDDFYYKMYYQLVVVLLDSRENRYRVFLDIKDTKGGPRLRTLHGYLAGKIGDPYHAVLASVNQIRSNESELLQLCDLIIGAIAYANRGLTGSSAKAALVETLERHGRPYFSPRNLGATSYLNEKKLNLLRWRRASAA